MWLIVLFDLPTETSQQRKEYTKFRTHLLKNGVYDDAILGLHKTFCERRKYRGTYKQSALGVAAARGSADA